MGSLLEVMSLLSKNMPTGSNPLTRWLNYIRMLGRSHKTANGGNALMLGSIGPLSSRAFDCLARDVLKVDQAYVVDIKASQAKRRQAAFVCGDALQLPFTHVKKQAD